MLAVVLRLERGVQSSQLLIGVHMKRAYVLAAVALVVVAGFVGQRLLSNDYEPAAMTSSGSVDDQAKFQAEQYAAAIEDLKERTEAASKPHHLVVTIRDEPPLEVWDTSCHLDQGPVAPTLGVFNEDYNLMTERVALPSNAEHLPSGGCEATVDVRVADIAAYQVSLIFEGRGISDGKQPPAVKREGKSQQVTVVE